MPEPTIGPMSVIVDIFANAINWKLIWHSMPALLKGASLTLLITVLAVSMGVAFGLAVAICRLNRRLWLRVPAGIYIEGFRCTPMVVQIMLIYYGIFPGIQNILDAVGVELIDFRSLPAFYSGVLALGLNSGAYLGEIFRGGILSIDKGQREAALSLGMGEYQVMRYVVLPQAFVNALPSIGNEFITMIKDTSLVAFISVAELMYQAMLIAARNYEYFTMYAGVGLVYFCMTFTTSRLLAYLEKRMRVGQRTDERKAQKRGRDKIRENA